MANENPSPSRQGPGAGGASAGPEERRNAGAEEQPKSLPEHRDMAHRRDLGEGDVDPNEHYLESEPDVTGTPCP
jgi:hypothetical protein